MTDNDPTVDVTPANYTTISLKKKPANYIYKCLINKDDELVVYYHRWNGTIPDFTEKIPFETYLKAFRNIYGISKITKFRDFQYRLLLGKIPLGTDLYQWGKIPSNLCYHCHAEEETFEDFFYSCPETKKLWNLFQEIFDVQNLSVCDVILNNFANSDKSIVNFVALIVKQYLYSVQCINTHRISTKELQSRIEVQFFFFFFKIFSADTYTCPILGPLIPLFWISGDISSGFQSQSGLPYSHCGGERNVRSLRSTSGATRCRPLDGKHCGAPTGFISCPRILLAPVGLEPAIKRS